ncbi:MAG: signal peptide peptidase SppA [Deltaproteobacteria bacterium]|nr:signal peptide peptidase SppA [Deltaproteobacteria bacterium]
MRRLIVRILAVIGGAVVMMVIASLIGVSMLYRATGGEDIPEKTIVEINFEQAFVEHQEDNSVTGVFSPQAPAIRDVLDTLEMAASDTRVVAVVARIGRNALGLAQIQEIRDAILTFRESGKPTIVHAEAFGESSPGTGAYYLATAFDEIYLQPSGDVGLTGLMYETPFIRGTLDKLGVVPRMDHRREYKSALNTFTQQKYTAPHRESTQKVMESQFGQIVQGIATARGLSEDTVRKLADRGPLPGQVALAEKLLDGLAYRDEVATKVKEQVGTEAKPLKFTKYLARAGRPHETGETIALIYGVGAVQRGKGSYDPMSGSAGLGSDTVTAAFRAAVEDKEVKAILFRVDSPGGSYIASDTIWRETLRAKEAGKPVVVSMGNVAGSGGYFVAMAADKIVAQPGTITGSIGVLAGKMLMGGFWEKIGVSWDEVHTSANATLWSATRDYTPQQWTQFQQELDRVYDDFTSKAAQGRKMPKDKLLEVAKGRIWTGEDAKALGLVDELGGFPLALRLTKAAAGIAETADVQLEVFPRRKTSFRQLVLERLFEDDDEIDPENPTTVLMRTVQQVQPLAQLAAQLGLAPSPGVLTMPQPKLTH